MHYPNLRQPSSSSVKQDICLPFNEAIKTLPMFLQSKDEHEQHEVSMFLSQVNKLYKSDSLYASASSILNYIQRILEAEPEIEENTSLVKSAGSRSEAFDSLPELSFKLQNVTEDIATEIASKVITNVDSHDITISVLNILQQYSWETKVALTITTYILTFGDFGLNLCSKFKVTLNNISLFVKQLLKITSCIVEFEKLPKGYMTSTDPDVKEARTHFIVAVYWIIRVVIVNSSSHIMTISRRDYKFGTPISPTLDEKLYLISLCLKTMLPLFQKLLVVEFDIEVYHKIKEIVQQDDHNDNLDVLKALISSNDDSPQLYDFSTKKKVHLNKLKGKYVLLLIACTTKNDHLIWIDFINGFQAKVKGKYNHELVFIPILDHYSPKRPSNNDTEFEYQKLKSMPKMKMYMVDEERMIKNEVIKLLTDDWNFTSDEPIIVTLDPQGNVVNQNAFPMIFIWHDNAFPFNSTREKELLEIEIERDVLSLNLLVSKTIDELIGKDDYTLFYRGTNIEWVSNLTKMVDFVASVMSIPIIKRFYVGKSHNDGSVQWVCRSIEYDNLSYYSGVPHPLRIWHFRRRIESIIYTMTRYGKVDDAKFQDIQKLHNYDKSDTEWAILAKGSEILVISNGNIVLTTLKEHELWHQKVIRYGFGEAFKSHYQRLYERQNHVRRVDLPTTALKDDLNNTLDYNKTVLCPDCNSKMKKCISFVCDHSSLDKDMHYIY